MSEYGLAAVSGAAVRSGLVDRCRCVLAICLGRGVTGAAEIWLEKGLRNMLLILGLAG